MVVLLAVAVLVLAGDAEAVTMLPALDSRVARDERIALDYWGARPPCTVEFRSARLPDGIGGRVNGGCRVELRSGYFSRPPAFLVRIQSAELCATVVHEWGHLLGYSHNDDPHSVMYSGGSAPTSVPACARMLRRPRMATSASGTSE